jgi:hypothetical protein
VLQINILSKINKKKDNSFKFYLKKYFYKNISPSQIVKNTFFFFFFLKIITNKLKMYKIIFFFWGGFYGKKKFFNFFFTKKKSIFYGFVASISLKKITIYI